MSLDRRAMESALPGYEIGHEIGRGAFGLVFEGRHLQLDRKVAIKQLPRALASDPTARQRFLTESRTVAALQHPHIVPVYDFVERDGLHLLVMEHLGGGTLAERSSAAPVPTGEACAIVVTIAQALQHAHDRGVLHRDVKPDNVLFTIDGVAKLADFGIAKLAEQPTRLTMTGTVVGTPAYLAPEVALGEEAAPAADIYALGVVLYELLAQRLPFPERPTAAAALLQRVNEDPAPIGELAPHLPPALAAIVMRAIARDPAARFASAGDLAAALGPFVERPAAAPAAGVPVDPGAGTHPTMAPLGVAVPDRLPVAASRRRTFVVAGAVVLVVAIVVAVVALLSGGGGDDETAGDTTSVSTTTTADGFIPNASLAVLTEATARFRTACEANNTAAQCQCAIDRIQKEIGLAAFVDVTNDLTTTGRTNRQNAVAIMAQCASR